MKEISTDKIKKRHVRKVETRHNIIIQPLQYSVFHQSLSIFRDIFLKSLGPGGSIKTVVNAGGHNVFTGSSNRFIDVLCVESPVLKMILASVKSQLKACDDFGLYTGSVICEFLQRVLYLNLTPHFVVEVIEMLTDLTLSCCDEYSLKINVGNASDLLALISSVVKTKSLLNISSLDIKHLSVNILRAHLLSFPEFGSDMGHVSVVMSDCGELSESKVVKGLLVRHPDLPFDKKLEIKMNQCNGKIFCILFLCSLGYEDDKINVQLELTVNVYKENAQVELCIWYLSRLNLKDIGLVVSQKRIHHIVRDWLRKRGIFCVERLGTHKADLFAQLAGARAVHSLVDIGSHDYGNLGSVDSVEHAIVANRSYLQIERNDCNIVSLLVCYAQHEECIEELRRQIDSSLATLRQLMRRPAALPGGGCFEMILSVRLVQAVQSLSKKNSIKRQIYLAFVSSLRQIIFQLVGQRTIFVDSVYRHVWLSDNIFDGRSYNCVCGMIRREVGRMEWIEIFGSHVLDTDCFSGEAPVQPNDKKPEILDCLIVKRNAIRLSLEVCTTLLSVGLCIYEKPL